VVYSNAENRVAALEQMFSIYHDQPADVMERMKATAEAFEQLSEANAQLEKYQRIYGDLSTLPPDVSRLGGTASYERGRDEKTATVGNATN